MADLRGLRLTLPSGQPVVLVTARPPVSPLPRTAPEPDPSALIFQTAPGQRSSPPGCGQPTWPGCPAPRDPHLLESLIQATTGLLAVLDARPGPGYQQLIYANPALLRRAPRAGRRGRAGSGTSGPGASGLGVSGPGTYGPADPAEWVPGHQDRAVVAGVLQHLDRQRLERQGPPCPQDRPPAAPTDLYLPDAGRWYEVTVTPVMRETGRPGGQIMQVLTHWAVVLRDSTERKSGEAFLQDFMKGTILALSDTPLERVFPQMLGGLERVARGWVAAIVMPQDDGDGLQVIGDRLPPRVRAWLASGTATRLRSVWAQRDPGWTRQAVRVDDPCRSAQLGPAALRLPGSGIQTSLEIPLYDVHHALLGVLLLVHPGTPRPLSQPVIQLLEGTAGHVAMLIERHHQRVRLEQLAYHDVLTGLLNRSGFARASAALGQAQQDQRPLALGVLDLNRFKHVNDSLGHGIGDELLAAVAERFQAVCADGGLHALTRLGGDEFAVLLDDPDAIQAVSARIVSALDRPFTLAGQPLKVGLALGWSVHLQTAGDVRTLLQQADAAMYTAKRGRFAVQVYQPAALLEQALLIATDQQQFHLVYQPQVRGGDRRVIGAEALLRWTPIRYWARSRLRRLFRWPRRWA